jgi:uncharacterized protein with NRDE domain
MLTNVRSTRSGPGRRSRGELPTRWLAGDIGMEELRASVEPGAFGGFNLVAGDLRSDTWSWLSNCHPDHPHTDQEQFLHSHPLVPGLYGLSNASLDTPWPKTLQLKSAVQESLDQVNDVDNAADWMLPLTRALADATLRDDALLPATGVPAEWERLLSSPFVSSVGRGYGTRSSVVMRVDRAPGQGGANRKVELHEWSHTPDTASESHRWNPHQHRSEFLVC